MKYDFEQYVRFCEDYSAAIEEAGNPQRSQIEETYIAALSDKNVEERLDSLREFFSRKISENVPLNWFTGEPLNNVMEKIEEKRDLNQATLLAGDISVEIEYFGEDDLIIPADDIRIAAVYGVLKYLEVHGRQDLYDKITAESFDHVLIDVYPPQFGVYSARMAFCIFDGEVEGELELFFEKSDNKGTV